MNPLIFEQLVAVGMFALGVVFGLCLRFYSQKFPEVKFDRMYGAPISSGSIGMDEAPQREEPHANDNL